MKYKILLLFFLCSFAVVAQEGETYKKTTKAFQENFNAQNVDAIFEMYSADMQNAMTKEGVERFVKGCYEQFGNLKTIMFKETTEGVHRYNAEFDNVTLIMELMLTDDGKIGEIQFQEL
ncbi:DUF3887 domain-containing protein [Aquimarina brevivitae]|uniref:Uncharacterized protein DUF3887 n=1 Tax=Aquimarina brevivitae TaxID=323412 RepID=A0A4Q7NYR2_9FLAO|nr:DUF3887 domain-containing protein [Aquimarina brevivitae]RZS92586.1 uncharacterized protein DUF3887 [Aquimarina brevivitae]